MKSRMVQKKCKKSGLYIVRLSKIKSGFSGMPVGVARMKIMVLSYIIMKILQMQHYLPKSAPLPSKIISQQTPSLLPALHQPPNQLKRKSTSKGRLHRGDGGNLEVVQSSIANKNTTGDIGAKLPGYCI